MKDQEQIWRDEFEKNRPFATPRNLVGEDIEWIQRNPSGDYKFMHVQVTWLGYLAACKARQTENKEALEALERIVEKLHIGGVDYVRIMPDLKTIKKALGGI